MTYDVGTRIVYRDLRLNLPATARPTDTGIFTIGCQANPLGVRPQIDPEPVDVFHSVASMKRLIEGAERWDVDQDEETESVDDWVLVKVAGPFHLGTDLAISCDECGWRGPARDDRRQLARDLEHVCLDPEQLPLKL